MEQQPARANPTPPSEGDNKADKRSLGQWAFDSLIYGGVINTLVFATSILATYLTNHGRQLVGKESKSLFAKFARGMQDRGEWLDSKLMKIGMNKERAGDFRMVAFSFIDGSIFAMLAKPLEDQRENIARWIDKRFSKEPVPEETYHKEPKQTWGSVFGGRVATFVAVFSTYKLLDKLHVKNAATGQFENLNKAIFTNTGERMGEAVSKWGWLRDSKLASKNSVFNLPGLFKVGVFEAFYTTVCTIGLYFTSRLFAGKREKKATHSAGAGPSVSANLPAPMASEANLHKEAVKASSAPVISASTADLPSQAARNFSDPSPQKPETRVNTIVLAERQALPQNQLAGA
jgi:hypothetical protein